MRLMVLATFSIALALPPHADAQSLGDVAAREREKREKAQKEKSKSPAKVYTEDDLRGRASSLGTVSQPGASGVATEAKPEGQAAPEATGQGDKKEKSEEEKRAEQEQAWRERLQKARQDVVQLTEKVNRLQTALNDFSGNLYGATRTNLLNQWEAAKKELAAAQQHVTDVEEEGRKSRFR